MPSGPKQSGTQVVGPSGMSKDLRASDIRCVWAFLFMSLVRDTLTVGGPAISNWYVAYTRHVCFGGPALIDVFFASSK